MSFQYSPDEEEKRKREGGNASSTSPYLSAPNAVATGGGQTSGAPTGTKFINLQKYLDVNKDKAAGMAGGVVDTVKDVDTNLNNDVNSFKSNADDYNRYTKAADANNDLINNWYVGDGHVATSNAELDKFNTLTDEEKANYTGPTHNQFQWENPTKNLNLILADNAAYRGNMEAKRTALSNIIGESFGADGSLGKAQKANAFTADDANGKMLRAQNIQAKAGGNYGGGMGGLDSVLVENVGQDKFKARNSAIDSAVKNQASTVSNIMPTIESTDSLREKVNGFDAGARAGEVKKNIDKTEADIAALNGRYVGLNKLIQEAKDHVAAKQAAANKAAEDARNTTPTTSTDSHSIAANDLVDGVKNASVASTVNNVVNTVTGRKKSWKF